MDGHSPERQYAPPQEDRDATTQPAGEVIDLYPEKRNAPEVAPKPEKSGVIEKIGDRVKAWWNDRGVKRVEGKIQKLEGEQEKAWDRMQSTDERRGKLRDQMERAEALLATSGIKFDSKVKEKIQGEVGVLSGHVAQEQVKIGHLREQIEAEERTKSDYEKKRDEAREAMDSRLQEKFDANNTEIASHEQSIGEFQEERGHLEARRSEIETKIADWKKMLATGEFPNKAVASQIQKGIDTLEKDRRDILKLQDLCNKRQKELEGRAGKLQEENKKYADRRMEIYGFRTPAEKKAFQESLAVWGAPEKTEVVPLKSGEANSGKAWKENFDAALGGEMQFQLPDSMAGRELSPEEAMALLMDQAEEGLDKKEIGGVSLTTEQKNGLLAKLIEKLLKLIFGAKAEGETAAAYQDAHRRSPKMKLGEAVKDWNTAYPDRALTLDPTHMDRRLTAESIRARLVGLMEKQNKKPVSDATQDEVAAFVGKEMEGPQQLSLKY